MNSIRLAGLRGLDASAHFPPPKRGSGLVLVPILVQTR